MALPVFATSTQSPFPNILFKDFSQTIAATFGSQITLATVLTLLFTLTDNPDLLNLHFRQQHPIESGENRVQVSGWITGLINALTNHLGKKKTSTLFFQHEYSESLWEEEGKKRKTALISRKLDKV